MRLDHLLSKEHLEPFGARRATPRRTSWGGAHGWNIDKVSGAAGALSTSLGTGTVLRTESGTCTLLGPEGPGRRRERSRRRNATQGFTSAGRMARRAEHRPSFENYTVDASILDMRSNARITKQFGQSSPACRWRSIRISCDINLLRADGGCLGIWSRRRTYEPAISLGELVTEP